MNGILFEEKAQIQLEQLLIIVFVVVGATIAAVFFKNTANTLTNTAQNQANP
jgi:uncharacterized protein (UPF0333 family)